MRAAISIEHPAWAHQFRYIINKINKDGKSLVLAVDKDGDLTLLDSFGIKYVKMADSTGKNVLVKGLLFVKSVSDGIAPLRYVLRESNDIYDLSGRLVRKDATTTEGLPSGIYVRRGKKIIVK